MNYLKNTLAKYLDELSSSSMAPGGGSGAAWTAAIGTALLEMVVRINDKRLKTQSKERLQAIKRFRAQASKLVTLDAKTFLKLSKIFLRKKKDARVYQVALLEGARTPLQICELSMRALEFAVAEKDRTSRWLASDLEEAGVLLEASFYAGRLNVEINLKDTSDKKFVSKTGAYLKSLEKKVVGHKKRLEEVRGK